MNNLRIGAAIAALAVSAGGFASVAAAQSADETSPPETAAAQADDGDIVVTAQKRSERLVDVPISVAYASSEQMEAAGIRDVADLAQIVPGFRLDQQGTYLQPTIRGVSSAVAGAGFSAPVATYIDGIYYPNQQGGNFEMADVASVQVLKGPQGTLFGRNATAGAILLTTKDPNFQTEGSLKFGYGRFNEFRGDVYLTTPLTSNLAVSVAAFGRQRDGFARNIVTGERLGDESAWAVRAKLLFQPTDQTDVQLTFSHNHTNDPNSTLYNAYEGRATAAIIPGAVVGIGRGQIANDYGSRALVDADSYVARIRHDFGEINLVSYTAYQTNDLRDPATFDIDASNLPLAAAADYSAYRKTFSQEFNLTGKTGRLDWVLGLFYMDDRATQRPVTISAGGGAPFEVLRTELNTKSYAAFADATLQLGEKFYLTLGARYEADEVSGFFALAPDYDATRTPAKETFHDFTPRIVARYELTPRSNFYASVGRGAKSGVINFAGPSIDPVRPEDILAYEVGFKTSSPGFQFEAAAFWYDYKDLQVTSFFNATSRLENAAKAKINGIEAHVALDITDNLRFDAGGAYLHDAKYLSFPAATLYQFDPLTGVTPVPADASGNRLPRSPKISANLGLTYSQELMSGEFSLSGNMFYQSKIYFDNFEEQSVTQGGYALVNARAAWTAPNERWTIAAYVKNLTDKSYVNQYTPQPAAILVTYGWPRTFGAEFTVRF